MWIGMWWSYIDRGYLQHFHSLLLSLCFMKCNSFWFQGSITVIISWMKILFKVNESVRCQLWGQDFILYLMGELTAIKTVILWNVLICLMLVNNGFTPLTETAVSLLEWQKSSDKKSAFEDVVESVDADIDCTCTGGCS